LNLSRSLWHQVCVKLWAWQKKRTKADNARRQADELEKKADTRPEQTPKKRTPREDEN
jgi:hypothetical protein